MASIFFSVEKMAKKNAYIYKIYSASIYINSTNSHIFNSVFYKSYLNIRCRTDHITTLKLPLKINDLILTYQPLGMPGSQQINIQINRHV